MPITSEQAMQNVRDAQAEMQKFPHLSDHYHGVAVGRAMTYMDLGIISFEQYKELFGL